MDLILLATSLKPDRSLIFTLTVVIAGIGIVLATLALLIFIFNIFGKIVSTSQRKAQEKKKKKLLNAMEQDRAVPQPPPIKNADAVPPPPEVEAGLSPEIVAAISAAVYMQEGADAVITSIRRKESPMKTRNPWAQAAVTDNTRPF